MSKTVIITGANSGIGYGACYHLLKKGGFKIIMAGRSKEKLEKAYKKLKEIDSTAELELRLLNLASLKNIKEFADGIKKDYTHIDYLLNNAGIMIPPFELTEDGFESQIAVNHLGHFSLTVQLLPLLLDSSRVVNVSSLAHKLYVKEQFDVDKLLVDEASYNPSHQYGKSKLSNILFTLELQNIFSKLKSNSLALACHPGISNTNLFKAKNIITKILVKIAMPILTLFMFQDKYKGALPSVAALLNEDVKGGDFFGPDGKREFKGNARKVEISRTFFKEEDLKKLWSKSEELTGIKLSDFVKIDSVENEEKE